MFNPKLHVSTDSQELFRRYADQSEDVVYRLRTWPQAKFEYINHAIERITGYTPAEFFADPNLSLKISHPDDLPHILKAMRKSGDYRVNITCRVITKDGDIVWMSWKTVPILEDAKFVGYEGVGRDVTREKHREQDLYEAHARLNESLKLLESEVTQRKQAEDRLNGALIAAHMGMWVWDMPSNRIEWSEGLHDLFGIPRGSFDGTFETYMRLIHPADRELISQSLQDSLEKGLAVLNEHRVILDDGSIRWLRGQGEIVKDSDGNPIAMRGICQDSTARKLSEQQLELEINQRKEAEQKLKSALAAANMGMWNWDMLTNRIEWTESVYTLFDTDRDQFDGSYESFLEQIHPADRELVAKGIQQSLAEGIPLVNEYRIILADGQIRWIGGQGNVYTDATGTPIGMRGICEDLTERKQDQAQLIEAKERAEAASRLKDSILANMSHEIRTPMTAVLGFAEILMERLAGSKDEEYAKIIHQGGTRLLYLLDSIIDLARIEADHIHLEPTSHSLKDPLTRVTKMMRVLAQKKGLSITVEPGTELYVFGDARREEQVFINIINNAIRFTANGSITISTSISAPDAVPMANVHIADTGIGISAGFLPHIFEEFRQESEGNRRKFEGSGLGLSIVKKLLGKMGGTISVESTEGVGTTFTVSLPIAAHAPENAGTPKYPLNSSPPRQQSKIEILVVEDDPDCGQLLVESLSPNFLVEVVHSGEDALKRAQEKLFKILVLDIHLKGGWDGVETLRNLRQVPGYSTTPAIALTAFAMKGDPEHFYKAGFDGYLAKPFNPFNLRELLFQHYLAGRQVPGEFKPV
jgi:PAS domain S-box-containing protein